MAKGMVLAKDIYKRGNGRWAKVTNQYRKVGTKVEYGVEMNVYETYYHVAFGVEGKYTANNGDDTRIKRQAIEAAIEWVKFGTVEGL
jgi:hypothetical protein